MAIALSVIIPTLNGREYLERTLGALPEAPAAGLALEILVVDAGSTDGTTAVARGVGARVLAAEPGRGSQLAAGAAAAGGQWLLFLHADTVPAPGWSRQVRAFVSDPANADRAACFRFALDDAAPAARRLEALVAWRCRLFCLPYGDQGLLISRRLYDALGGFRPMPLMEDVEFVRRIGRRRLAILDWPATTSAARYRAEGYLRRPARNLVCLTLYFLGLPSRWLARLYG